MFDIENNLIIDFHVHVFPDDVATKAIEALYSAYGLQPFADGTVNGLLQLMKKTHVDYSVIQPVATKPSSVQNINNWAGSHKEQGIISFGAIHPDFDDIESEINRIISMGIKGIKIQGNWQYTAIDDRKMYPIYEAAQEKLILMFHMGDEFSPFDIMHATPKMLANVLKDFPKLIVVGAHMGGFRMWDEVIQYLIGKDLYLDTSACKEEFMDDELLLNMIHSHGTDKILFATDLPLSNPSDDISRLIKLGLSDTELKQILGINAKMLLGL
jgi:uncharacterized protein